MDVVTAARTSPPPVTPPATPPFTRYTRPSAYESTRIGFVVYSYTAVVSFDLTTYGNKQMMIEHIWRLDYMSSSTNTASGLLVITSHVITSEGQTSVRTIVCVCRRSYRLRKRTDIARSMHALDINVISLFLISYSKVIFYEKKIIFKIICQRYNL